MIDLHCHSTCSDGELTPTALIEASHRLGIRTLALTDHDTVFGLAEATEAGRRLGVEVIPGVEISATQRGGGSLHVIGLFVDPGSAALSAALGRLVSARDGRNQKIAARLAELGMPIDLEAIPRRPGETLGRPLIAAAMVARGYVRTVEEAFERWIGDGRPAHLGKEVLSPAEAVAAIHAAGGIACLAHPLSYAKGPAQAEALLADCRLVGMDAVEVYYPTHTAGETSYLACFADRHGLLRSGGSDFHGGAARALPADLDGERLEALRERARGRRPS